MGIAAASSATQTYIAGGSGSDMFKSALIGAGTSAAGTYVNANVLHGLQGGSTGYMAAGATNVGGKYLLHVAGHGLVGGAISAAQGGSFRDGFIASAVTAAASPITNQIGASLNLGTPGTGSRTQVLGRTLLAGAVGGTASALGGGKFANGFVTAAMQHLFNDEKVFEPTTEELLKIEPRLGLGRYQSIQFVEASSTVTIDWDGHPRGYLNPNYSGADAANRIAMDVSGNYPADRENVEDPILTEGGRYRQARTSLRGVDGLPINSSAVPYIALAGTEIKQFHVKKGDYFLLFNSDNNYVSEAIYADSRGSRFEGIELSSAAMSNLGYNFKRIRNAYHPVESYNIYVFKYIHR
jgi:hypothetical protein